MKRQIRKCVFETNSSSMHSVVVMKDGKKLGPSDFIAHTYSDGSRDYWNVPLNVNGEWDLRDEDMEFGREYQWLVGFEDKVEYAIASLAGRYCSHNWLEQIEDTVREVVPEFAGFVFRKGSYWDDEDESMDYYGYVDHQSQELLTNFLYSEQISLHDFLLDEHYVIITDDDSCSFQRLCATGKIDISKIDRVVDECESYDNIDTLVEEWKKWDESTGW